MRYVAMLAGLWLSGCAAGEVTVGGRVVDLVTHEPVPGVLMRVGPLVADGQDVDTKFQTTSGPDGSYRFVLPADLPPDHASLLLLKEGYARTFTTVSGVPIIRTDNRPVEPFLRDKSTGLYDPIEIRRDTK